MPLDAITVVFLSITVFVWLQYSRVRGVGHGRRYFVAGMLMLTGVAMVELFFPRSSPPVLQQSAAQAPAPEPVQTSKTLPTQPGSAPLPK